MKPEDIVSAKIIEYSACNPKYIWEIVLGDGRVLYSKVSPNAKVIQNCFNTQDEAILDLARFLVDLPKHYHPKPSD
jgi:hypothetical protein